MRKCPKCGGTSVEASFDYQRPSVVAWWTCYGCRIVSPPVVMDIAVAEMGTETVDELVLKGWEAQIAAGQVYALEPDETP